MEIVSTDTARPKKEKGFALVMVLSLSVLIISMVAESIFFSDITARTALGERNRMNAEMAAYTGAQFAQLLIRLDSALKSLPEEVRKGAEAAFGGKPLYGFLNGIPISGQGFEGVEGLEKLDVKAILGEPLVNALKTMPGYFSIQVTNESSKLNLNLVSGAEKTTIKLALERLFSTPREAKFLEDKGYPPKRLVANLVDYIDTNKEDDLDKSDETSIYERAKLKYKAKNAPLESLEELRRIPGFNDDEIFDLFTPYLTVWPMAPSEKGLDINSVSVELISALVTKEGAEINDAEIDKLEDKKAENFRVSTERDISKFLSEIAGGVDVPTAISGRLFGLESNVFKVEVRGYSGGIERTLVAIYDRSKPKTKGLPPIRIVYQRFN
jgi:type II secretory pathway component PulK